MKKTFVSKGLKLLVNEKYRFIILSNLGIFNKLSDEEYLKKRFKIAMERNLDLNSPKTFNEKLQWLKLYDRKPEYTIMVDKYAVREYISEHLGEEYLIPLLGVWNSPEEIDFNTLPDQFVLKCNHNSGFGMCICKDKSKLNQAAVKKRLQQGLNQDYYMICREWPYKNVPRKIIAEKYMSDNHGELRDYKFFCFNGKVRCFKVDFDRFQNHRANYFDIHKKLLPVGEQICPPDFSREIEIPDNIDNMIALAEKISAGHSFLRVDFYSISGKIYFGELTFFPASGFGKFIPEEYDMILGNWLTLPKEE